MPREQVNFVDLDRKQRLVDAAKDQDLGGTHGPWNDPAVYVQWHTDEHDGWVQVGFETDIDYAKFAAISPNGQRDDRTVMWTDTLSRAEINKMIRALRRAREAAFGADE